MDKTLSFILIAFSLTALVCVGVAISMATYFYLLPIDTKDVCFLIDNIFLILFSLKPKQFKSMQ
jgi:hypothetical protein